MELARQPDTSYYILRLILILQIPIRQVYINWVTAQLRLRHVISFGINSLIFQPNVKLHQRVVLALLRMAIISALSLDLLIGFWA
jgi:hypothetical protein